MEVFITEMMEEGHLKKNIFSYLRSNKIKVKRRLIIAMMVIMAIIVIIFIDLIYKKNKEISKNKNEQSYDILNINFKECTDENTIKFISDYFKARTALDYPKLFAYFGRDYYKEKREAKNDAIKIIENTIRYERTFVREYSNIKVYEEKGFREGEKVCVVTYDLLLGFTNDKAPMIITFYLEPSEKTYVIREVFDVGTSKYLMDCMDTPFIKSLYEEIKIRLTRLLASNESMKLAYNSLRQFEMNMGKVTNYEESKTYDMNKIRDFDPIKDADKIYDYVVGVRQDEKTKRELETFLNRVVASLSEIQKVQNIVGIEK